MVGGGTGRKDIEKEDSWLNYISQPEGYAGRLGFELTWQNACLVYRKPGFDVSTIKLGMHCTYKFQYSRGKEGDLNLKVFLSYTQTLRSIWDTWDFGHAHTVVSWKVLLCVM